MRHATRGPAAQRHADLYTAHQVHQSIESTCHSGALISAWLAEEDLEITPGQLAQVARGRRHLIGLK